MCGGITNMQSRRASDRHLYHQLMKHNIVSAQLPPPHAAADHHHRRHQAPAAPAGLAIVAALVQSGGVKSAQTTKLAAEPAPASSRPIPISSANEKVNKANQINNNEDNNFPVYCTAKNYGRGIFSTSLSPPDSNVMSCKLYREDDFLGLCLSCNRPLPPGKDIFMYRGDRAFCSTECRHKNIVADESLLRNIQINQQCVQSSSNQPKFTPAVAMAILV